MDKKKSVEYASSVKTCKVVQPAVKGEFEYFISYETKNERDGVIVSAKSGSLAIEKLMGIVGGFRLIDVHEV